MISYIAEKIGERVLNYKAVSGGDIAEAYVLETSNGRLFLKTLQNRDAMHIFTVEASGLQEIRNSKSIAVPEIISVGEFDKSSFLLLGYVDNRRANAKDFEKLGRGVALMHQTSADLYGFESDNFIGLLPQKNNQRSSWSTFYAFERLKPQIVLAHELGHLSATEIPAETKLLDTCNRLLKERSPALLHGDLWSGNYLISKNGTPYLIDPAVYYGHREADLAMTKLFGSFDKSFYQAYYEIWPKEPGEAERIEIYQLYHLLVHLNLFGLGYKASVKRTLEKYFL